MGAAMSDRATADPDPFRAWIEASRAFLDSEPEGQALGQALGEPIRQQCESLFAAWSRFAGTYAAAAQGAAGGAGASTGQAGATGGPSDPLAWMDAGSAGGFGDLWRWFGGGAGGVQDGWQAEREALMGSGEWAAYALALGRYQAVMAEGWLKAFGRFSEALAAEQGDGRQAGGKQGGARKGGAKKGTDTRRDAAPAAESLSWETIRARWQEAADLELARTMRSDAFLAAQRDLVRARLDCAALIRSRLERLADLFDMPTRADTDGLAERLHRLEREVRALRARAEGAG